MFYQVQVSYIFFFSPLRFILKPFLPRLLPVFFLGVIKIVILSVRKVLYKWNPLLLLLLIIITVPQFCSVYILYFCFSLFRILDAWKSMRTSYLNVTVLVDWITSWMPKIP